MRDPLHDLDKDIPPIKGGVVVSPVADGDVIVGHTPMPDTPPTTPGIATEEPPVANLAVVFVHGMGTSKPGDMLEGYLNPSLEWIKRATTDDHSWYLNNDVDLNLVEGVNILERNRKPDPSPAVPPTAASGSSQSMIGQVDIASIPKALLHSAALSPAVFQPPYIDVDLTRLTTGTAETKKMVAVEAWWDGEFEPPPFRLVANWALGVAPSLILRHLALVWERDPGSDEHTLSASQMSLRPSPSPLKGLGRMVSGFVFTIVGGLIAIFFQWAICLLLALGFVPFLQKYVSVIILKMTTSFGDVLAYVHDGVRSAAIRSTVLRSFLWLHKNYRVERLIVIGHSLGSVISYDVLNSCDLLKKVVDKDVTFVTFGSPLKKANMLLHLKRDEQRTSLGMLFAWLSLVSAIAALVSGSSGDGVVGGEPLTSWQWIFIAATGIGAVALGIGAHARPILLGSADQPSTVTLSLAQYMGLILTVIGGIALLVEVAVPWGLLAMAGLVAMALWARRVSASRTQPFYDPYRTSQSMGFCIVLLGFVAFAGVSGFLPAVACFLLAALILSVMTGSNPLEEFRLAGKHYERRMPKFSFGTPIKKWIDFWATNDLVAEYGLDDVRYIPAPGVTVEAQPVSRRVTNMKSYTADHTSYRQNLEQFIAPLTRLFLEELDFRVPDSTSGQNVGALRSFLGTAPVYGTYEQDITNAMRSRSSRMRWLSWAGGLLMLTFLLFSPSVYRSVGEYIVFDERNPVSISGAGEPARGPAWFTTFYNRDPKVCGDILCRIRHLPIIPDDVSESLIRNQFTGNVILYGLGYGLAFALASFLVRAFLRTPWRIWESALLDTIVQLKTSRGANYMLRAGMFALAVLATAGLAFWVHAGYWGNWLGSAWLWEQELTPAQTFWAFLRWILAPFLAG